MTPTPWTDLPPRMRAIEWAKDMIDRNAVVIDTETTGKEVTTAEVVDIAVVAMDGRVLLDAFCCPLRAIPKEASDVHGITERDVHKALMWRELFPKVAAVLANRTVIVWNVGYDLAVINNCCRADKLPEFPPPWEDAMLAYGEWYGEIGRFGGYKWHRLGVAAERFGITPGGHRALADALACLAVIRAMAEAESTP